jgi:hypothetical protein
MADPASAESTIETGTPSGDPSFRARLPYTSGADGLLRPYVVLDVHGPNQSDVRLRGLIDTGADRTSMPASFISLFGYAEDHLLPQIVSLQSGTRRVLSAHIPLRATVVGEPDAAFELMPIFLEDLPEVLLGRDDFMNAFSVSIVEASKEFSLFKR